MARPPLRRSRPPFRPQLGCGSVQAAAGGPQQAHEAAITASRRRPSVQGSGCGHTAASRPPRTVRPRAGLCTPLSSSCGSSPRHHVAVQRRGQLLGLPLPAGGRRVVHGRLRRRWDGHAPATAVLPTACLLAAKAALLALWMPARPPPAGDAPVPEQGGLPPSPQASHTRPLCLAPKVASPNRASMARRCRSARSCPSSKRQGIVNWGLECQLEAVVLQSHESVAVMLTHAAALLLLLQVARLPLTTACGLPAQL